MILIIVSEGWYLFLQCVCYSSYPFCLRAHGFLIDGWGDAHQQVPLIHVVGWCLDDVIARVTTYKRQKLLPWRSFFFFFPVVKCGQSLKQWNECVNLHKGKERHSRVLECLCLCMCVCVIVCRNACVLLKHFCSQSLLNSTWQSTASYVISGLCYTESWPTRSVDCKINGCYLQYMFLAAKSQRNIQGLCASVFPPPSVRHLKAVKSACRPDLFVSCGISHVV